MMSWCSDTCRGRHIAGTVVDVAVTGGGAAAVAADGGCGGSYDRSMIID